LTAEDQLWESFGCQWKEWAACFAASCLDFWRNDFSLVFGQAVISSFQTGAGLVQKKCIHGAGCDGVQGGVRADKKIWPTENSNSDTHIFILCGANKQ